MKHLTLLAQFYDDKDPLTPSMRIFNECGGTKIADFDMVPVKWRRIRCNMRMEYGRENGVYFSRLYLRRSSISRERP